MAMQYVVCQKKTNMKIVNFFLLFLFVSSIGICQTVSDCPNMFDNNDDNLVNISDLLDLLVVFGDSDSDDDGVWDSMDYCIDVNACNFQANPTAPCAELDVVGVCGGGCEVDADGDGLCDCSIGWMGPNCDEMNLNVNIIVNKIYVSNYPMSDSGTPWDPLINSSSAPDPFWQFQKPEGYIYEGGIIYNATGYTLVYSSVNLPFTIFSTQIDATNHIRLYDHDDIGGDDFMGGYYFTPLNFIDSPGDEFPETFQLSGGISFVLEVEYEWLD